MIRLMGALAVVLCAAVPTAAAAYRLGEVEFEDCTLNAQGDAWVRPAQCARVAVAEDPQRPETRRIELDVAVLPSRRPTPLPDPVVFLAGGPGQSARDAYPMVAAAFAPLRGERDILLIDQRGTGGSNPLRCAVSELLQDAEPSDAELQAMARDCLAAVSRRADVRHYTTADAVRDLESLRRRFGIPGYNLVGTSYGTRVALEYLRRHPGRVRSVVLDGVVPPELALGQEHAANLESALDKIFAACVAERGCFERFGDPRDTLRALRARLRQAPMKVEMPHPQTFERIEAELHEATLAGVVRFYAYLPEFATTLPLLLDRALAGDPRPLVAQGELIFDDMSQSIAWGVQLSVMCSEDADLLHPVESDAASLLGNSLQQLAAAQCAVWPHKPRPIDFHEPVVSDRPVLLLSGEWDPVTPPRYAEAVARHLHNARHLVVNGAGHITLGRGCMPQLLDDFIDDPRPAALDTECLAPLSAPPFFVGFQGPEP